MTFCGYLHALRQTTGQIWMLCTLNDFLLSEMSIFWTRAACELWLANNGSKHALQSLFNMPFMHTYTHHMKTTVHISISTYQMTVLQSDTLALIWALQTHESDRVNVLLVHDVDDLTWHSCWCFSPTNLGLMPHFHRSLAWCGWAQLFNDGITLSDNFQEKACSLLPWICRKYRNKTGMKTQDYLRTRWLLYICCI